MNNSTSTVDTGSSTVDLLTDAYVDLYPQEAARALEAAAVSDVVQLLSDLSPRRAAAVLQRLDPEIGSQCVARLPDSVARDLLPLMDLPRLVPLLRRLEASVLQGRLALLEPSLAKEVRELMTYPPGTAGDLMDPRVMSFRTDLTAQEVLAQLHTLRQRRVRDLFLVDDSGRLVGLVPLHEVILAEPSQRLGELVKDPGSSIQATALQEEIVNIQAEHRLASLPVLDFEGRLLGVIRQDALVQAVQDEASVGVQTMVGVSKEERALSPAVFAVRKRLPWLNINLLTAFLAATVVGLFEDTIAQVTALAVLLPVVAGQSGNTGAQALAVTIRGLALREIRISQWPRIVRKEAAAGTLNGVAIAIVTMVGVYIWSRNVALCGVIGAAMVLSMAIAGIAGSVIPVLLTALRQDPAQSSSIILTTVTDVVGFLSFLGLAAIFASLL